MCRAIKTLYNFKPPATDDEIRASSLAVRPQAERLHAAFAANEEAFARAVDQVTHAARQLIDSLVTTAPARDREVEAAKAKARAPRARRTRG